MKLFLLILSCVALSVAFVSGGNNSHVHGRDLNFTSVYDLSSILQKTAFSKVFDETFHIRGRPKYLAHHIPIEEQLLAMTHEVFLKLNPNIIVRMVADLKNAINHSMPMLEKYEPDFARNFDQHIKADLSRLGRRIRFGIRFIHNIVQGNRNDRNDSSSINKTLLDLAGYMGWLENYITSKPLNATNHDLKKTLFAVIDILAKLPKISDFQRNLCKIAKDKRMYPIVRTVTLSQQGYIFHFRRTIRFAFHHMVKSMIESFLRIPPVQKMIGHLQAVLSNSTISALKRFFERNGPAILEEKMRLKMAILFRPKGTFTQLKDFAPYLTRLINIVKDLPKNLTSAVPIFDKIKTSNMSVAALIRKMNQPGQITRACLKMTKLYPKEILQKLQARPGFENDTKSYCQVIEGYHRHFMHMPKYMLDGLKYAGKMYDIPENFLRKTHATFMPGNIHFVGLIRNNPNRFYKELQNKGALHKMVPVFISNRKHFLHAVSGRVANIIFAMFGETYCPRRPGHH